MMLLKNLLPVNPCVRFIYTSTTIITSLMMFLIQNTLNRDYDIVHLELDELIRATHEAQSATLGSEHMEPRELGKLGSSTARYVNRAG